MQGDVETVADRIAGVRTWAYIAHRPDWLADPAKWAERTRELEERLSDALHQRLTQRFVDRRTAVLMRDLGAKGIDALPVAIDAAGIVSVADEPIGRLEGFRFHVDPDARLLDKKRLLAAAERRLGDTLAGRARTLAADPDDRFTLATDPGRPVAIFWRGDVVARFERGRTTLAPRIVLHRALDLLRTPDRILVEDRLIAWLMTRVDQVLRPLSAIAAAATDPVRPAQLRALLAPLVEAGGTIERAAIATTVDALDRDARRAAQALGVRIGTMDVFHAGLLKPEPMRWRLALAAIREGSMMPDCPPAGAVALPAPETRATGSAYQRAGFRLLGEQMLRVDMIERLARIAHEGRPGGRGGRSAFVPDPALPTSLGLAPDSFARLLLLLGFRTTPEGWAWRGQRPAPVAVAPVARPGNAFGALAALKAGHG